MSNPFSPSPLTLREVQNTFHDCILGQARRQDSVTGGELILGGHEKFIYMNLRGHGAREVYSSMDQTKKVKTKKKGLQCKNFHKFWLSSQNSCDFPRIPK